jgi:hypothetical protein
MPGSGAAAKVSSKFRAGRASRGGCEAGGWPGGKLDPEKLDAEELDGEKPASDLVTDISLPAPADPFGENPCAESSSTT